MQWQFNKGLLSAHDTVQSAEAAAKSGCWEILGWLLQCSWLLDSSLNRSWQNACWPCNHIFDLPEQQALLELQGLDAFVDLADIVRSSGQSPSWLAAKSGHISSLQWLRECWPSCAETSFAALAAAAFGRHWTKWCANECWVRAYGGPEMADISRALPLS